MTKLNFPLLFTSRAAWLGSAAFVIAVSQAQASDTDEPQGVGYSIEIPAPARMFPLPILETYRNQTGKDAKGEDVRAYDDRDNPVIKILSGFNRIWTLGDEKWADGGANGDGPANFNNVKVVDPDIWQENMRYVLSVTGENRTKAAAFHAYMNDRRSQGYSVIDGMGPLAQWYREGAGATTTINHAMADFDPDTVVERKEDDKGTEAGAADSQLSTFVAFMKIMRGPEGTTSPAKYFYSSPRPWRMNDKGDVIQTGEEQIGDKSFERYESDPGVVVPALKYVRETRGRQKDGGFPSGHTNAAYLSAIAYAYAVPERFAELLTSASELGESRIVAGMHSPLDVIGGRITATAMAAAILNDSKNADAKKAAYLELQAYFAKRLPQGQTLQAFAHGEDKEADRFADEAENKTDFRKRMTYSFARNANINAPMVVPEGAEVLLETRLPYLDAAQRRAVLFSTGIQSGYPLLDDSNGWGRINLVAAASGYGSFDGDVDVRMNASAGGFNAADRWTNDIDGKGRLVKSGDGKLTLSGENSYSGGTIVEDGMLSVAAPKALGSGDVAISGGRLDLEATGGVDVGGEFHQSGGELAMDPQKGGLRVAKAVALDGGVLKLTFDTAPATGTRYDVVSGTSLNGTFTKIDAGSVNIKPVYTGNTLTVIIQ